MLDPIDQSAGRGFSIVDRARFDAHPKSRKPRDRARMLYSPASEDWVTWTAFALLERYAPTIWWPDLVILANRENPRLVMPTGWHEIPQVRLWQTVRSPRGYECASRERMRLSDDPAWVSRCDDPRPVEGESEIDIVLRNDALLVFMEAKLTSDVSLRTTCDPRRDQILRNIDCVLDRAEDRVPIFWLIVRDTSADRAYTHVTSSISVSIPMRRRCGTRLQALAGSARRISIFRSIFRIRPGRTSSSSAPSWRS